MHRMIVVTAALALVLTGCGGNGGTSPTATDPLAGIPKFQESVAYTGPEEADGLTPFLEEHLGGIVRLDVQILDPPVPSAQERSRPAYVVLGYSGCADGVYCGGTEILMEEVSLGGDSTVSYDGGAWRLSGYFLVLSFVGPGTGGVMSARLKPLPSERVLELLADGDGDGDGATPGAASESAPSSEATPTGPGPAAGDQTLREGQTVTLYNRGRRAAVEVTLHGLSYPEPKPYDKPSKGNALVLLEMTIRNVGEKPVYGTNVYPAWLGDDGRAIDDTGWVIAPFGKYATGEYTEELSDTVGVGQYIRGFGLYEIPADESGTLVFPYGPSTMLIDVDPTARR